MKKLTFQKKKKAFQKGFNVCLKFLHAPNWFWKGGSTKSSEVRQQSFIYSYGILLTISFTSSQCPYLLFTIPQNAVKGRFSHFTLKFLTTIFVAHTQQIWVQVPKRFSIKSGLGFQKMHVAVLNSASVKWPV